MSSTPSGTGNEAPRGWLAQRGEMGALIAQFPWEQTPLGSLDTWPTSLRVTVNLMMLAAGAMAIVWGEDYRLLYNDAYRDVIQTKHPAALGQPTAVVFAEIWPQLQPLFVQVSAGKAVLIEDILLPFIRHGHASESFFSFTYNPIADENGQVRGFLAIVIETTERLRKERERTQVFDTTLSAIADFAYTFDLQGRFTYINQPLLRLWGLSLAEAVGKNFFELHYPPELAERLQRQIQEVITHKRPVRDETVYVNPRGHYGYYEYIFSPVLGLDGAVTLVAGSTRDITLRKRLEDELRQAKVTLEAQANSLEAQVRDRTLKLQDTVTELESLTYSISHDLRGPLRAMQSFAEALREDCGDRLGPVGTDYVRRIVAAAGRMDKVTREVLVYTRMAQAEIPLEKIALEEFVPSLLDTYHSQSVKAVDIQVDPDLPVVWGTQANLTQCLANLVGNAVKFVAPGKKPTVRISATVKEGRALICIADNGIGIPSAQLEAIFRPFYRLDAASEGTGIGLAVVKRAAERMGGRITAASEIGVGSVFTLELAAAAARAEPPAPQTGS